MSIFDGKVCNECGHIATKYDRKPIHRCQECNTPYELVYDVSNEQSTENIEPVYDNFWRRVGSAIVDGLFIYFFLKVLTILNMSVQAASSAMVNILFSILAISYVVLMHAHYGKTIGKYIFSIKVSHKDLNKNISVYSACLREIYPIHILIAYVFYELYELLFINVDVVDISYLYRLYIVNLVLSSAGLIWFALEVVTMLFNPKRRAIHDYLAGSVVVRT